MPSSIIGCVNETQVATEGAGLADLYRSHGDHFRRVAYLATGSREAAEDLVQEAYLRVQQRWDELDVPAAYLRVVLVNLCMAWNGRSAMERERIVAARGQVIEAPEIDETWGLLTDLPRDQRVVLVLRYYDDLSTEEIARILGINPGTVRTRIHRALSKLRREQSR